MNRCPKCNSIETIEKYTISTQEDPEGHVLIKVLSMAVCPYCNVDFNVYGSQEIKDYGHLRGSIKDHFLDRVKENLLLYTFNANHDNDVEEDVKSKSEK